MSAVDYKRKEMIISKREEEKLLLPLNRHQK